MRRDAREREREWDGEELPRLSPGVGCDSTAPEPWIINYVIQSVAIEVPVFPALLRTSAILGHFCTDNVRKSLIARRMMNC